MVNAVHLCLYTVGFTCSSVGTTSRSFPSNLSWAEVWERIDTGTWGTPVVTSLPARWLSTKSRGLNPSNPQPPVTTGRQTVLQTLLKQSFKPFLTLQTLPKKHPGPHALPKALLSPRPPPAPGTGPAPPQARPGTGPGPWGRPAGDRSWLAAGRRPAGTASAFPFPFLPFPFPPRPPASPFCFRFSLSSAAGGGAAMENGAVYNETTEPHCKEPHRPCGCTRQHLKGWRLPAKVLQPVLPRSSAWKRLCPEGLALKKMRSS
nr:CKLF-like MARVEL transmembrane domain-containing protein 6 isoform X2 [Anser cygnoides]